MNYMKAVVPYYALDCFLLLLAWKNLIAVTNRLPSTHLVFCS